MQRPLDDQSQVRIRVEAEVILNIVALVEAGDVELVSSEILVFELDRMSDEIRRGATRAVLEKAKTEVLLDDGIEARAETFVEQGIKPLDALHLASAEIAEADYFCTCDSSSKFNQIRFQ